MSLLEPVLRPPHLFGRTAKSRFGDYYDAIETNFFKVCDCFFAPWSQFFVASFANRCRSKQTNDLFISFGSIDLTRCQDFHDIIFLLLMIYVVSSVFIGSLCCFFVSTTACIVHLLISIDTKTFSNYMWMILERPIFWLDHFNLVHWKPMNFFCITAGD